MNLKLIVVSLFLSLVHSQDMSSLLTDANPLHVIQHFAASSGKGVTQEDAEMIRNLPSNFFSIKDNVSGISKSCYNSIDNYEKDFPQESYTLQVLDAWGKPESGILNGNVKWLGRYFECSNINYDYFKGKYCSVYVGKPPAPAAYGIGFPTGLTVGGCFPDTCSQEDISSLIKSLAQNKTSIVDCPVQFTEWGAKEILGIIILLLLFLIVIASSLYDLKSNMNAKFKSEFSDKVVLQINSFEEGPQFKRGKIHQILTSFSIIQNTRRFLVTTQRPTDITCLHGMRFISMSWVIIGHSFLISVEYSDNMKFVGEYFINHFEFQAIGNATLSVDSFFFLSGLLVVYLGMRELKKRNGKINIPLMYVHRYIRLTPPYAFLILMSVSLWPKFGTGPMWPDLAQPLQAQCDKYWWTNLLYINNLYPSDSLNGVCLPWSWYLANDTQFYILAPFFLLALYKFPGLGVALLSIVLTASITITGVFSSITQQQPQPVTLGVFAKIFTSLSLPALNQTSEVMQADLVGADPPQYSPYMSDIYTKPWCRIGAYIVGMITGFILHYNNNKVKMPKLAVVLGWLLAAGTCSSIIYCLYPTFITGHVLDNNTAAFYNAMSRPMWAVGLAWVTVACVSGYGGPINKFLSWKGFIPLSRLTYCAYLIHPLVVRWLVVSRETLLHYSISTIISIFLTTLVLANLLAYFVAMLIEFPVVELMKILQGGKHTVSAQLQTTLKFDTNLRQFGEEHDA
ncbi:nose resistant to fluoxetine protein 6-like [Clavelina lepadiformis]|uniref:nose resistant to fluoxetine protein 6-like n=1 Tax=Clavelina lepadiformis TaxID=159417 RepID=UPI004041162B